MLKAKDVMTTDVITTNPDERLEDAIAQLIENKISGMPVCDSDGKMVGMLTEKDVLNFIFSGHLHQTKVKEAMSRNVISFSPDTELDKISLCIAEKKIRRVPIIEDGTLVGVVSRRDIMRIVLAIKR
jgi:CBS domain-containing protein